MEADFCTLLSAEIDNADHKIGARLAVRWRRPPGGAVARPLGRRRGEPLQWRRWVYFNVDFRYQPSDVIATAEQCLRSVIDSVNLPMQIESQHTAINTFKYGLDRGAHAGHV